MSQVEMGGTLLSGGHQSSSPFIVGFAGFILAQEALRRAHVSPRIKGSSRLQTLGLKLTSCVFLPFPPACSLPCLPFPLHGRREASGRNEKQRTEGGVLSPSLAFLSRLQRQILTKAYWYARQRDNGGATRTATNLHARHARRYLSRERKFS